ncbi:MAG: ATP-dependent DNA helicase RecG, partial [Anaerolineae bacterium]|nr:ATP-dependent DNA helicase RecG [Anaerolineae bacterium]
YWSKRLPDYLPLPMRERLGFLSREQAVAQMHFPDDANSLAKARRRLAFDEFLVLQLGVLRQRRYWREEAGIPIQVDSALLGAFLAGLPYQLTGAQQRVLDEIVRDIKDDRPMSRLLQGDVGSGKTVVAAAAMLIVAKAGYQSTMMAPTEILAEQHFATVGQLLAAHGVCVRLLTGSVPQAEKETIYAEIASGKIDVLVGTHAVIQQDVQFARLALAVIDEQHRFGVRQRGVLRGKGYNPHMLVMSATPIPRTLALTAYGDLDLSIIDEMPPGRQPIQTKWFMPAERERAYRFVQSQIEKGRQAYIICPLVEESDKIEAKSAVQEHSRLQESIFPNLRLGLLHGRLKGEEKERVMHQFSAHELDILVSTSVVEVGIDVPNATVMMIEGANRFGLSQLHQFRGRVGRGEHASFCILIADTVTDVGEERLRAIEETQDGFKLAERDLEMRGPGDFFGTRQSGLPELKLASLGDTPLLELARREAQTIFAEDPTLSQPAHRLLAARVDAFWGGEGDLS